MKNHKHRWTYEKINGDKEHYHYFLRCHRCEAQMVKAWNDAWKIIRFSQGIIRRYGQYTANFYIKNINWETLEIEWII